MSDLTEVLINARNKLIFKTREEFIKHLGIILETDTELKLDWDDGAGEEWARISHKEHGIVYMINMQIGIIFARRSYQNKIPEKFYTIYEISVVDNYHVDEWCVNLNALKLKVPEIDWQASEDVVNPKCFSLNDFYFVTV